MITTETNPGRLNPDNFKYTVQTVTIRGIMYLRGDGHRWPRGFYNIDSANHVAALYHGTVVRFGCCYAVAFGDNF